jgi:hypothetical protein
VEELDRLINSGLKSQLFKRDWNEEVIVDFEIFNPFNVLILEGQRQQFVEALICIHKPFRDLSVCIYTQYIQGVTESCGQALGTSFSYQNRKKFIY